MANEAKLLRKQIKNVLADILPDLVKDEKQNALYKELSEQLNKRVDHLTKVIKETLDAIDQRSKDIQGYVVRQSGLQVQQSEPQTEKQPESTAATNE